MQLTSEILELFERGTISNNEVECFGHGPTPPPVHDVFGVQDRVGTLNIGATSVN